MVTLPGYIITEEIYEYNRFKVYRAQTVQDRLQVLVKTLNTGANTADITKLINEYEITSNLNIGGVIKPVRLERAGLTIALIMEDNGAIPLRAHLKNSTPALSLFFSIAIQLTETLGEFHQQGFIHRDLQLDAIFIHPGTEQVKIADLSIATLMPPKEPSELLSNSAAGAPAYMSPERIGRTGRAIDQRSDLYSLGVLFYEVLTGQLPLRAGNNLQWLHAHMAQKPVEPGELNPEIPPTVTAIIMKLLAKTTGERYQSATGLLADLEECRRQWSQNGVIEPFIPGLVDSAGCFQLPHKLYGREKEIALLTDAFAGACSGLSGLMLVHGYAGTGKTVLIQETLRPLAGKKGYFITGKSDQLQRNIPYAPFGEAFGNLMRQLLTESQESLAAWKKILHRALGKSGAVITEVVPEVTLLAGPQYPVENLPPWEAQNRFRLVFRNFVKAFACKEHPLVIFLDDLQWADSATLELIQYLSKDVGSRYLFLVGAYRDNEITGVSPLMTTLEGLQKAMIVVRHLSLEPLTLDPTVQFIADTLHCPAEQSQSLAEILYCKTGGNPFFLGQLLQIAYEKNVLNFNSKKARWEWELASIYKMPMSDDVIKLLLGKLQTLPDETRNILKLAACLGNTFDVKTLAIACAQTPLQTAADLRPALVAGLILPGNGSGRMQKAAQHVNKAVFEVDCEASYEFLHDRIQQVAYDLVPAMEKKEVHLKLGWMLLRNLVQNALDENIYDIMDHLNRSLDLITDPTERIRLAEYNLLAGRKAKVATAYGSALHFFTSGLKLLPDNAWDDFYQLTFNLCLERSQCDYLCAHWDTAEQIFALLFAKVRTDLDKADLYSIQMALNIGMDKYQETLQLGRKGLSLLGVTLPEIPGKVAFIKEFLLAKWWLLRNPKINEVTELSEKPADPVQKKVIMLLLAQANAAALVNHDLYMFIILKIGRLAIKYGNTELSPIGYICYSFFTGSMLGKYKSGHVFAQTALKLIKKYDNSSSRGLCYFMLGTYVNHWTEHIKTSIVYLQKAVNYGLETGEFLLAGYAMTMLIENKYLAGGSLAELYQECQRYYNFTKGARILIYQLLLVNLRGLAGDTNTLGDEDCDEEDLRKLLEGDNIAVMAYYIAKLQLYYLDNDYESAFAIAEKAQQNIHALRGHLLFAEYNFYYSLAITAVYDGLLVNQRQKYWKLLKKNQRQLQKWSNCCHVNFRHKYLLVAAEIARLSGKDNTAMSLYDQSIQSAHEHGYIQDEAIAGELAARFYLTKGRDKIAQVYLPDACHGYYRWGATRKVRSLKAQYPHLLVRRLIEEEELANREILHNACWCTGIGDNSFTDDLELYTSQKAIQILAEATNPAVLLQNLLEIAIENAGADKGFLVLEEDEKLFVAAASEDVVQPTPLIAPLPLEKSTNLSQAMVRYVIRTLEPVVQNNGEQSGLFAGDPYTAQSCAKSIACLPVVFRGVPVGALYLENSLMTGAFTPDRLAALKHLTTQIAYVKKLHACSAAETAAAKETLLPLIEPLTERELEVLRLIAAGLSNKEIAQELQLTISTVKTHILNIYGKLQVNRRVQAVTRAKELKLLSNNLP